MHRRWRSFLAGVCGHYIPGVDTRAARTDGANFFYLSEINRPASKIFRFSKKVSSQAALSPPIQVRIVFLACTLKIEYPATQIHSLQCRKASDSGGRAMTACGNPAEVRKATAEPTRQNDSIKGAERQTSDRKAAIGTPSRNNSGSHNDTPAQPQPSHNGGSSERSSEG